MMRMVWPQRGVLVAIMTTYINISGQTLDIIDVEAIVVVYHVLKNISSLLGVIWTIWTCNWFKESMFNFWKQNI
jgi:hypothetical protein